MALSFLSRVFFPPFQMAHAPVHAPDHLIDTVKINSVGHFMDTLPGQQKLKLVKK
jgi:hypothetical protein